MVRRQKLKGISGMAPERRGICGLCWLNTGNVTGHYEDGQSSFLIQWMVVGAWLLLIGGVICPVDSDNGWDICLPVAPATHYRYAIREPR